MGVDNDRFVCELGPLPISSVDRDSWKIGWEAAAMLDCLMSGGTLSQGHVLVAPARVVARESTRTIPVSDPFLAGLIARARAHLDKPFGVEWFVEHGKRSRRWLEMRFRDELGHTPMEIINRLRVGKARDLLANPGGESRSLTDIAAQCGFTDLRQLRVVFNRHTGMTPAQYRRAHLLRPPPSVVIE
jgi:LacI family transcriptional regulator